MCPPLDPRREVYKQISTSSPSPLASMLIFSLETTFLQLEKKKKKKLKKLHAQGLCNAEGCGFNSCSGNKDPTCGEVQQGHTKQRIYHLTISEYTVQEC